MEQHLPEHSLALCAVLSALDLPAGETMLKALSGLEEKDFSHALDALLSGGVIRLRDGVLELTGRMPPGRLHRLFARAEAPLPQGSFSEALLQWHKGSARGFLERAADILKTAVQAEDIVAARYLYGAIAGILAEADPGGKGQPDPQQFLAATMQVQRMMQRYPWSVDAASALYEKMRAAAEKSGDRRSLSWILLSMGMLNINMGDASAAERNHSAMGEGVRLVSELGDRSIFQQSSGMVCLWHFIEGEFTRAVHCAYSCLFMEGQEDVDYERILFSYAALSAVEMGECRKAISILDSAIARARDRKTLLNVDGLRAILAYACLLDGNEERAIQIIDTLWGMAAPSGLTYATFTSARVLAFYHYSHGRLEQAWNILRERLPQDSSLGLVHSNCLAMPFMLEMLGAFCRAGLPSPFNESFEEELEIALRSPSRVQRAVAWRVKSTLPAARESDGGKLGCLEKSAGLLRGSEAYAERFRTLEALARAHLDEGRRDLARSAVCEALSLCSPDKNFSLADDLRRLAEEMDIAGPASLPSPASILLEAMQALRQQYTWETASDFFASLLCSLMTACSLMRGAFLRVDEAPVLLAAVDFPPDYLERERNIRQQAVLERARREGSAWSRLEGSRSLAMAVHISTEDQGQYVCFMEGVPAETFPSVLGKEFFALAEGFCATEITMFRKSVDMWKGQVKSGPSPSLARESAELWFHSEKMEKLVEHLDRLASRDTTILLLGESGVGKELAARRLHEKSGRPGDFIAVNIASTPEELFESEFYGHEKGSFTGAAYQKRGLFELADGGTLFIDEVADIPMFLQIKLLRVLQERTFYRVGGTRPLHSDFRLVAATNRRLEDAVRKGTFREDLYYRISVVPVHIPPLRERPEDILFLARAFLAQYAARDPSRPRTFSEEAEKAMLSYSWPGNVRELKNFAERYSLMPEQTRLREIAPPERMERAAQAPSFEGHPSLAELEDRYFEHLYVELGGAVGGKSGIASVLGISRTTAYAWIERLGLKERFEKKIVRR